MDFFFTICRISYEPAYLDIGEGISYRIPPSYDKLAASLNLPSFSDIRVEEFYLKGTLDLGSLAEMMSNDKRFGPRSRAGMGEPRSQYESLQARLKAMAASNSGQKFSLKISDAVLNSSIPEGAAGNIQRSILSEGGVLQVYYVKVLEKGDTYEVCVPFELPILVYCFGYYSFKFSTKLVMDFFHSAIPTFPEMQIIERSLPKKPKVKKDPAVIEREEMEKIGKVWVNIVRRDIPKHHRSFTNLNRKHLIDAKRFSETCQREVRFCCSAFIILHIFFFVKYVYDSLLIPSSPAYFPSVLWWLMCYVSGKIEG